MLTLLKTDPKSGVNLTLLGISVPKKQIDSARVTALSAPWGLAREPCRGLATHKPAGIARNAARDAVTSPKRKKARRGNLPCGPSRRI